MDSGRQAFGSSMDSVCAYIVDDGRRINRRLRIERRQVAIAGLVHEGRVRVKRVRVE